MAEVWQVKDRRVPADLGAIYERLIDSLRSGDFGPTILDLVGSEAGGAARLYLFEASGRDDSTLHFHHCEPGIAAQFPLYSRSYRRIDPVCDAYRFAPVPGDVAVQRIKGADIAIPDFRRRFFDETGIVERISIIQRGPVYWRVMNVARDLTLGRFSQAEMDALLSIAWLALPLLSLSGKHAPAPSLPKLADLEVRFAMRFPTLSPRECEVCARAARGMSVEATALDLGIGKASVLTYRRRAYQRLEISSPFELSALVTH